MQRLANYWGEVFGGPPAYSGAHGGHTVMLAVHAHSGAGKDLADRFVACFVAALDGAHLLADPEVRAALGRYIRRATDEVMTYSAADARVPAALAMPRWDLDGLRR